MYDVLIKGGRIIDPSQALDQIADVAFENGKVADLAPAIPAEQARRVVDASGRVVTPGLIDLHTHVYWGGTSLGIDADTIARRQRHHPPSSMPAARDQAIFWAFGATSSSAPRPASWPISTSPSPASMRSAKT